MGGSTNKRDISQMSLLPLINQEILFEENFSHEPSNQRRTDSESERGGLHQADVSFPSFVLKHSNQVFDLCAICFNDDKRPCCCNLLK